MTTSTQNPVILARSLGRPRRRISNRWIRVVPIALVLLVAIVSIFWTPFDPRRVSGNASELPGSVHWFGTDASGFDVLSRTMAATGTNLLIATMVTVMATVAGIALGLAIGMNESARGIRGTISHGLGRFLDLTEAIPGVIVGLIAVALYGATILTITIAIAIVLLPIQARLVRSEVLRVRSESYLDAARIMGMSEFQLSIRHVLPNSSWSALEYSSVIFAVSIILTAALGFIGVGLPPPTPEWGYMLSQGATDVLVGRWWAATFPAAALAFTIFAVSMASAAVFNGRRR